VWSPVAGPASDKGFRHVGAKLAARAAAFFALPPTSTSTYR
jgi:hypothetical protein